RYPRRESHRCARRIRGGTLGRLASHLLAGVAPCPAGEISTPDRRRSRLPGAMLRKKVPTLYALRALFAQLRSDSRGGAPSHQDASGPSASPLLVFVAAVLLLLVSILLVDQHRDELRALGLVGGTEQVNPVFMSP